MIEPTGTPNKQNLPHLDPLAKPRELSADEIRFTIRIDGEFASTRDVIGAKEFVGQERALA